MINADAKPTNNHLKINLFLLIVASLTLINGSVNNPRKEPLTDLLSKSIIKYHVFVKENSKMIRPPQVSPPIIFLIVCVVLPAVNLSCARPARESVPPADFPLYRSQKKIVKQGYTEVPTPYGPRRSIYFGYDRNRDLQRGGSGKIGGGIDIIEYKIIKSDGTWHWEPFLVFSDDNFDGIADRLFLDSDLDGFLDKMYDVALKGLVMDKITFEKVKPWQGDQPLELPKKSPGLI
jgi:hypothetical protein